LAEIIAAFWRDPQDYIGCSALPAGYWLLAAPLTAESQDRG
jgi:hypothetical protein